MATTAHSRPPFTGRRYTIDEFDKFSREDWPIRVELLHGQLLVNGCPSSRHQALCLRLAVVLDLYARPLDYGLVFSPGAIVAAPGVVFQPDVLVTPWTARLLPWEEMTKWSLAVEVLSHSTRATDLGSKRKCYQQLNVGEYWIVDGEAQSVTVVRRGADMRIEPPAALTWQPVPAVTPLTIDLVAVFADV